jgi:hypothetical protein
MVVWLAGMFTADEPPAFAATHSPLSQAPGQQADQTMGCKPAESKQIQTGFANVQLSTLYPSVTVLLPWRLQSLLAVAHAVL